MLSLALRLLLAPSLVALASLGAARFGARVGGLLASLPVVGGPILLLFALDQGNHFASQAANHTILGVVPLAVYSVVYARLAPLRAHRAWWLICLLCGVAAYLLVAWLLRDVPSSLGLNLLSALASLGLGYRLVPRGVSPLTSPAHAAPSTLRGLGLRMAAAAVLVLALTTTASLLGPARSGLLVPFPVASTVLVVGTHLGSGAAAVARLLRGFLAGLVGFVAFLAVLTLELVPWGLGWGFAAALGASLILQTFFVLRTSPRERPGGRSEPESP